MRKPTRRFLRSQLKLPFRKKVKQPAISTDYVIVRVDDQLVVDFRAGHSTRQAIMFYRRGYRKAFRGDSIPDVTAIERRAFPPDAVIKRGQTYVYDLVRAT